jgi:hypothetical protein
MDTKTAEETRVFRLDALKEVKSKDELKVKFRGLHSKMPQTSYRFDCFNQTKGTAYQVYIFKNSVSDWLIQCYCPAWRECKHLVAAKALFEQIKEGLERI